MGPGSPFIDNVTEGDIDKACLVDQFIPAQNQAYRQGGCETWSCAWAPDATYFAWSSGNRMVQLVPWNRYKQTTVKRDGEDLDGRCLSYPESTIDAGDLVWAVAFGSSTANKKPGSTNLNWYRYKVARDLVLATGLSNGRIRVWNVRTGLLHLELLDHRDVIRNLKFAPDGSMRMVSASRDGTLKVWDLLDDGNMMATLKSSSQWVYACSWSPDARMLCSVGSNKSVLLWDMILLKRLRKLGGHHNDVSACDFSPDGALLVTSSYDTTVVIWDPHTGDKLKELRHFNPPPSPIYAGGDNGAYVRGVSFSHDGQHVASVADDMYIRFWSIFSPNIPEQIAVVPDALCCSYSPDGAVLAVGTRNGSVAMWLSPMHVSRLQDLCRLAIRRLLPSTQISKLGLPAKLFHFLLYKDYKMNDETSIQILQNNI